MDYKAYPTRNIGGLLSKTFLHNPLTPVIGVFLLLVGYIALEVMPREENPQMVVSGGSVIVALPGATAKEISNIIVKPLERKMKEIKGVEHIYGMAMDNVGIVNVSFFIGEKKEESNLKIYDKVMQNMDILPKGAMSPIIKPLDIDIDLPVASIAFYSKDKSVTEAALYKKVKEIQHELNAIENVAITAIKGGHRQQFNVLVDIGKLSAYHLSLAQVQEAIASLATNVPDVKTKTKEQDLVIFGIKNAIESIEDVENIIVAQHLGSAIYLKDIATIKDGHDIQNYKSTWISVKGEQGFTDILPQVTLTVSKLQGTNAVIIAGAVKEKLLSLQEGLREKGMYYTITRNDGERANDAVNELVFHLVISVIIIILLLIFVLGWKEAMIVTFTIPAIFAVTLFVAYLGDQTINRITLFAFLLSLGLLVDDAIVVVENIHRHLHLPGAEEKSSELIMVEATDEIGASTNIATFAIILTMVPMAFVGQMMGEFMGPIPANVPVAMFASLIIAYMYTPYLANKMLTKKKAKK